MAGKRGIFSILLAVILLSLAVLSYQVSSPYSLSLNISKISYAPNESIDGTAVIFFNRPVSWDTSVKLSITNSTSVSKKLKALFDELSISYKSEAGKAALSNPTSSKTLSFSEAGSQQISLKLPKSAAVNSIDADIEGLQLNSTYPSSPSINVANDNTVEWQYSGSLSGYLDRSYPSNLDQNTDSPTIVKDNGLYYCEIFNLPSSKDFRISAKYSMYSATSTTGNMTATISSFQNASGSYTLTGSNRCLLQEPSSTTASWFSCDISLANQVSGNYMVCVQNRNMTNQNNNVYKLSTDSSTATKAFTCQNNGGACASFTNNFYLAVQPGNYSTSFSERQKLSQGETQYSLKQSITNYLSSSACQSTGDCAVPLYVSSNSKGKILISNLLIQYTSGGVTREEKNFYDLSSQPGAIYEINSINISQNLSTNVSVSLDSVSDLTSPSSSGRYELIFEVSPGPKEKIAFNVNSSLQASPGTSVETYLQNTKGKVESLLSSYPLMLKLTELEPQMASALETISARQQEVSSILSSNESNSSRLEQIRTEVKTLVSQLPKSIISKQSIADKVSVSPQDIPENILNPGQSVEKVYFYQKTLSINANANLYEITFFGGPIAQLTFVEKTISNVKPGSKVYESIPSYVIGSGDIAFDPQENPVSDGLFEFGSASKISYVYEGNLLTQLGLLKTFVIPSELPTAIKQTLATCGDNVCSILQVGDEEIRIEDEITCPQDCKPKAPWTWIIIIIVLGVIGIAYINFFSKKGNMFSSKKDDGLFANPKDLQNLHDYISKASEKGVTREKIHEILLSKGWTKSQVDHAYSTLKGK